MSILRLGATKQYSDNWENIFGGSRKSSTKKKQSVKKKPAKKHGAKPAKKASRRK